MIENRPKLDDKLDCKVFKDYYYLKEELVEFCKKNNMQISGSKQELTDRIYEFLKTGKKTYIKKNYVKKNELIGDITLDTIIENNFVCTQKHREFYESKIGKNFSFNVAFQKWLKENSRKNI